jgi:hypothetical protein
LQARLVCWPARSRNKSADDQSILAHGPQNPRAWPACARDATAIWDELVAFRVAANKLGYRSVGTAALLTWEWLQQEEHVFGAFEISHYRPKERPNSVKIVHPKNGEEAWWPLFDEAGEPLFPELMMELDAIKETMVSGLVLSARP